MKTTAELAAVAALAVLAASVAHAGELVESKESWQSGGLRGWTNVTGAMDVRHTATVPDLGGALGSFDGQAVAFPEVDSFLADARASGGMFVGDYRADSVTPVRVAFDFFAAEVPPSALWFQLVGSYAGKTNSFMLSLTNQAPAAGIWYRIEIPLRYEGLNWMGGGSGQDFTNALRGVRALEVRLVRRDTGGQGYTLDNFALVRDIPSSTATNDTDRDGLPDYWEQAHFNNPTNASATGDSDSDRMRNLDEFIAGTDPRDGASVPRITGFDRSGGTLTMQFPSVQGRSYAAEHAGSVQTPQWSGVVGVVTGHGGYMTLSVTNTALQQFYRMRVTKP